MMKLTERQLLHAIDIEQDPQVLDYLEAQYNKYFGKFGLRKVTSYIAQHNKSFLRE